MKKKADRARNLLHNHPMLRKGGVHDKSNKAKRRKERQNLRKAWFSLSTHCVLREDHVAAVSSLLTLTLNYLTGKPLTDCSFEIKTFVSFPSTI
ncbi:MAG: hypothetical protein JAY99_04475 [Candidatus Thiodiazotropha lotti]|nr:hypothetical protein [Candidatus Thiodiazotropha lotti]MCG7998759.1 hypothetical protein [Candidatus Thiodiazotropha lotti]MCW4184354.1 hypothetical protein [Candidatus Thiodiazotropha weberae]MCW4190525.1 hypothetical protein [Candidatus Thiodiazotropha weberae]